MILVILTLVLSVAGSALKNSVLTWASVPLWIVTGLYINSNYTWLGATQWVFILLGFGLAVGMAFETTSYRTKVATPEGDEIEPELQSLIDQRENWNKSMRIYRKVMGERAKVIKRKPRYNDRWGF